VRWGRFWKSPSRSKLAQGFLQPFYYPGFALPRWVFFCLIAFSMFRIRFLIFSLRINVMLWTSSIVMKLHLGGVRKVSTSHLSIDLKFEWLLLKGVFLGTPISLEQTRALVLQATCVKWPCGSRKSTFCGGEIDLDVPNEAGCLFLPTE
jgi:hypothetical protein